MDKSIQSALFNEIRSKLEANQSLVNEVAELLGISIDSTYRRIRGEKQLTLDETGRLSVHFGISVDSLLRIKSGNLLFNYQTLGKVNPRYIEFLESILNDLLQMKPDNQLEVIIAAKDFPVFYNFFYPEIAGFKSFFWKKTILQLPECKNQKFNCSMIDEQEIAIGQKIAKLFCRFKTHQLWNEEVFTSFINQIIYYYESGFMNHKSDAAHLIDKTLQLVSHFQEMAESGSHFFPKNEPAGDDSFQLYQNDVIFGDNTIIINSSDFKRVYFTHNVIDTLYTHDPEFCGNSYTTHKTIMNRSVLLSKSSERERNRFFKKITDKIDSKRRFIT